MSDRVGWKDLQDFIDLDRVSEYFSGLPSDIYERWPTAEQIAEKMKDGEKKIWGDFGNRKWHFIVRDEKTFRIREIPIVENP